MEAISCVLYTATQQKFTVFDEGDSTKKSSGALAPSFIDSFQSHTSVAHVKMSAKEALLRALALKGSVPDDNLGAWSWKREGRSDKEKYEVRCRPPHHDRDPTEFTGSDVLF